MPLSALLDKLLTESHAIFENPQAIVSQSFEFSSLTKISPLTSGQRNPGQFITSLHQSQKETSIYMLVHDGDTVTTAGSSIPLCNDSFSLSYFLNTPTMQKLSDSTKM